MNKLLLTLFLGLMVVGQALAEMRPGLEPHCYTLGPSADMDEHYLTHDWSRHFKTLSSENQKPFVGSTSWYWDPDTPGIGASITMQQSKHSDTGIYVFGAIYTYKNSGEQAWYSFDGFYEPTTPDDDAYWQFDREDFGTRDSWANATRDMPPVVHNCWWGYSDTYLGEINGSLYETANGMPLAGEHKPNDIWLAGDIKVRWVNPGEIEIYLDGESSPSHTFERHRFSGEPGKEADFLTQNHYYVDGVAFQYFRKWIKCGDDGDCYHSFGAYNVAGTVTFRRFNHLDEFTDPIWPIGTYENAVGYKSDLVYYISTTPLNGGRDVDFYQGIAPYLNTYFYSPDWFSHRYVVLAYDPKTNWITAQIFETSDWGGDLSRGLNGDNGAFLYKAPLPPADHASINLFIGPNSGSNLRYDRANVSKGAMYRSGLVLYRMPDMGGAFSQLPHAIDGTFNIPVE